MELGFLDRTIFSGVSQMKPSPFISAMHPKTEILPQNEAIQKILSQGWWGQIKIHGHRAQIHIPSDNSEPLIAYTRKGGTHKRALDPELEAELRRLLKPESGWSVVDCEWMKGDKRLFLFDFLKREGRLLSHLSYEERYELLPRIYKSDYIETLVPLKTLASCREALNRPEAFVEGLVFRNPSSKGFSDTSIIRCRR